MKYDFDMLSVTPKDIQSKYAQLFVRFGMTNQACEQIAIFRDPDTARALSGASFAVRDCFVASGFALNSYATGMDEGAFAADDKDGRAYVLGQLQENVEALPSDVRWNGFDIGDFFVAAYGAMPAPRQRRFFSEARRAVLPPMTLMPSDRIASRITSRALSTPAPGL
ncbi:MAG: hypothetical protein AAF222_05590 [Pseudomonadota bacterium]